VCSFKTEELLYLLFTLSLLLPFSLSPLLFPTGAARYNPGMSFDKLVEAKIKEAMENGEFDNLAGSGKPLDLSAYFNTPEEVRLGYSILKNAGVIPPEAELLREVDVLKEKLVRCTSEKERTKLKKQIDDTLLKYNMLVEHYRKKRR
jgi:hypothetical protein